MKKVLIAEDDRFLMKMGQAKLTKGGYEVIPAVNGDEALSKAKKEKPDIILLDIIMPQKNGFEVLELLRKDKKFKKTPILILSNLGQESDIKRGKELGATDYIVKSNMSISEVLKKVESYVKP